MRRVATNLSHTRPIEMVAQCGAACTLCEHPSRRGPVVHQLHRVVTAGAAPRYRRLRKVTKTNKTQETK